MIDLQGYCRFVVIPPANELRATSENPLKWVKTIDSSAEYELCRLQLSVAKSLEVGTNHLGLGFSLDLFQDRVNLDRFHALRT